MNGPIKVSVVIPCFNHGEFLPEAAASVTNVGRPDVEVIVVDDGSTDHRTRAEMDRLVSEGIHLIRQENKGLAAARNAGIAASSGEYVLPLDADNRLRPAYIEHGIQILDSNPRVGVVYGDARLIGIRTWRWEIGPFDIYRLLHRNFIDACAIYRRAVWEQNHGYDGTMPVQGWEDWDFWLGAVEHGWQFVYVPEILFDYRTAADSMITRTRDFDLQVREFLGRKHALLYYQQFSQMFRERLSVRRTSLRLVELVQRRVRRRIQLALRNGWAWGSEHADR